MKETTKIGKTSVRATAGEAAEEAAGRAEDTGREAAETAAGVVREAAEQTRRLSQEQGERISTMAQASVDGMGKLADRSRQEMEILLESGAIVGRGMQEIGSETAKFSKQSVDRVMSALNDGLRCRTLPDVWQVQLELLHDSLAMVLESNARLSELSARVASDALRPFDNGRVAA